MTDEEVIRFLGGPTAVARLVGVSRPQVVSNWVVRGIPAQHRPLVLELAEARGAEIDRRRFLRLPPLGAAA